MNFTGAAIVAGVAGWPIKHSRSPRIHNYWLKKYGIDGVYVPLAIPPDRAKDAIRMLPVLGIRGLNVTVPNKEEAYKAMDEVDRWAQRMKAVNTVMVRDGILYGANTDAFGFLESLREARLDRRSFSAPAAQPVQSSPGSRMPVRRKSASPTARRNGRLPSATNSIILSARCCGNTAPMRWKTRYLS